jgi:predicted transcriptional regulator
MNDLSRDEMRITIRLAGDAKRAVEHMASAKKAKIADIIRRAIGTEYFLFEQQTRGAKILIQDQEGTRQIVFR